MKIALDATYSLGRNLSGVGVYCRRLLQGLTAAHPETRFTFCYRPHRFLASLREPVPPNARRRILLPPFVPATSLFHGLNQRVPPGRVRRLVVTFHDLFVISGEYSTAEFRERFAAQAREAAARADLILAVSAFTGRQVEALLGVDASRIRIVPHGVDPPAPPVGVPREPMVLHVGAIQKRKNIIRLIEAFPALPAPWKLVLAGSTGYEGEAALEAARTSRAAGRIEIRGYVDNRELEALYARASIFAFPSLDEGFGLPVLEAMARGLPVLTSNCSSLPEVAGEAALLVDPVQTAEIETGLLRLAEDAAFRDTLAVRGLERVKLFSWEAAVDATWTAYRELA